MLEKNIGAGAGQDRVAKIEVNFGDIVPIEKHQEEVKIDIEQGETVKTEIETEEEEVKIEKWIAEQLRTPPGSKGGTKTEKGQEAPHHQEEDKELEQITQTRGQNSDGAQLGLQVVDRN